MAIWLVRAGSLGEYENKFIIEKRVYLTWQGLDTNLLTLKDRKELLDVLANLNPDSKQNTLKNWVSQVWPFAHSIRPKDWVVVPLKSQPVVYIGEVLDDYEFNPTGPDPFFHFRSVKWIGEAIPRSRFGQDLLFSFGAFMTICRIQRNNAEPRIKAMWESGWKAETTADVVKAVNISASSTEGEDGLESQSGILDLEEIARDQVAAMVNAKLKGHGLSRLVEAILKAQGYTTYRSPEGADGGVDILAGTGSLGFGSPRLCVQVKSQDNPIESKAVNELVGAMQSVNAEQGLLVSWNGFKSSVPKLIPGNFFRVRLWGQNEILQHFFENYEHFDDDLKAELPLKRVWVVATEA